MNKEALRLVSLSPLDLRIHFIESDISTIISRWMMCYKFFDIFKICFSCFVYMYGIFVLQSLGLKQNQKVKRRKLDVQTDVILFID